jgi:DNA-directed RNA polymerase specialized sigma subunit
MEVPENRQGPEEMLGIALRSELALEALASLTPRERFVAQAYYAGHDLSAIGRTIGIGESGASRVHVSALRNMKTYFRLRGRTAA